MPQRAAWVAPEASCEFDSTQHHPRSQLLVAEFVAKASNGDFDHGEDWMRTAVECVGHQPGTDVFYIARTHTVTPLDSTVDLVRVVLTRNLIGFHTSMPRFGREPSIAVDTLAIVRTPYGWRITNPVWDWASIDAALRKKWIAPSDTL